MVGLGESGEQRGLMGILAKTVSVWGNIWGFSIWWKGRGDWEKVGKLLGNGDLGCVVGGFGVGFGDEWGLKGVNFEVSP